MNLKGVFHSWMKRFEASHLLLRFIQHGQWEAFISRVDD